MAIRNIPAAALSNCWELSDNLAELGITCVKERREIRCCHDVLTIWADRFTHRGSLVSLDHLSNPDDPPDVRAVFADGSVVDMEHTSTEPPHRHQADKLRGPIGGLIPPLSGTFASTQELREALNPWSGVPWANVESEAAALYKLLSAAMKKKIEKHPPGGVLVLDGDSFTKDLIRPKILYEAFRAIRAAPGAEKWTFCYLARSNSIEFYSAIFSPTIDFEERRPPPPDPTKIRELLRNPDGSPYNGEWPLDLLEF